MGSSTNLFLFMFLMGTLISQSQSQTCKSQTFTNNRTFAHCADLPHLDAFLHWTHDPQNDSLAVAFLAPPPSAAGWVAWAVNPNATGMIGAQALLASVSSAPTVRTYSISGRSLGPPGPLSFDAWNLSAEFSDDRFTIYAAIKVPDGAKSVNQVWQVGPGLNSDGAPRPHATQPANLNAKGVLEFEPTTGGGGSGSPSPPGGGGGESGSPSPPKNAAAGSTAGKMGLLVGLFVLGIIGF